MHFLNTEEFIIWKIFKIPIECAQIELSRHMLSSVNKMHINQDAASTCSVVSIEC